jgi:hypothetical protein
MVTLLQFGYVPAYIVRSPVHKRVGVQVAVHEQPEGTGSQGNVPVPCHLTARDAVVIASRHKPGCVLPCRGMSTLDRLNHGASTASP